MIAAHAIRLGIDVLKPIAEHHRYDLFFNLPDQALRVQCKWAPLQDGVVLLRVYSSRRGPEGLRRCGYTADEIDAIAGYCPDLDRCFLVPMAVVAGRLAVHLRTVPARNNQIGGVNMASEYELGAVAQLGERRHGMAEVRGSSPLSSTPRTNGETMVGAHLFRNRFGYWMELAAAGTEVLITRHGKRFARLGPADPPLDLETGDDD
jgi:hypothetical protein